ncbi:asparagine synthase-related protein [Ochrobactrum sp. GPK 3]|uniref:asparagine synthase-related protein n=1 Tax=Brucella sp. 22210 TaxID=3453892 RepID=UPI0031385AD3
MHIGHFKNLQPSFRPAYVDFTEHDVPAGFVSMKSIHKLQGNRGEFFLSSHATYLQISRPLHSAHDLVFCFRKGRWWLSDDYSTLADMFEELLVDPDFIAAYLSSSEEATDKTPFIGIQGIMPGTVVRLDKDGGYCVLVTSEGEDAPFGDKDIPHSLIKYIDQYNTGHRRFLIELSGGLDSTGLLYTSLEATKDPASVLCVTYVDPYVKNGRDVKAAEGLCQRNNVEHITLPVHPEGMISKALTAYTQKPPRPSPWLLFTALQISLREHINSLHGEIAVLNGHGGDHIFLACPTTSAVLDYLLQRPPHPGRALEVAKTLGVLRQFSWFGMARQCLDESYKLLSAKFGALPASARFSDPNRSILTDECLRKSAAGRARIAQLLQCGSKEHPVNRRRRQAMNAVHHGSIDRITDSNCPTLYPYLNRTLLSWALHRPDSATFSTQFNRLPQRRSFYERYGDDVFFSQGKGHLNGLVQRMFREESDEVTHLIMNGEAARHGFVNPEGLFCDMERCRLGGIPPTPATFLVASLELYYKIWRRV